MGDLLTQEVTGILKYVPYREFERIRKYKISNIENSNAFISNKENII